MAIKITLQREAHQIFTRMAKEAGMGLHDLAEIACYNLIALYTKEHGEEIAPEVYSPQPDPSSEPNHSVLERT